LAKQGAIDLALKEDLETIFLYSTLGQNVKAMDQIPHSPYILVGNSDAGAKVHLAPRTGIGVADRAKNQVRSFRDQCRSTRFTGSDFDDSTMAFP
jgi:hypothetical protein